MMLPSCKMGIFLLLFFFIDVVNSAPAVVQDTSIGHVQRGRVARMRGCYHNYVYFENGERISTNEPCLNCTCIDSMLMCYLWVCPYVKPMGEECTVEKSEKDCCPKITCPEVPKEKECDDPDHVGKHGQPGCFLEDNHYEEGEMLPRDPKNPCEVCYCIRNSTACVMQECELKIEGCIPVYRGDQCCPCRYNCTHAHEELTTPAPPGLAFEGATAGCIAPDGTFVEEGEELMPKHPCEHCYCLKNEIICAYQECLAPGENCSPIPPPPGQCCPDRYLCPESTEPSALSLTHDTFITDQTKKESGVKTSYQKGVGIKGTPSKVESVEQPIGTKLETIPTSISSQNDFGTVIADETGNEGVYKKATDLNNIKSRDEDPLPLVIPGKITDTATRVSSDTLEVSIKGIPPKQLEFKEVSSKKVSRIKTRPEDLEIGAVARPHAPSIKGVFEEVNDYVATPPQSMLSDYGLTVKNGSVGGRISYYPSSDSITKSEASDSEKLKDKLYSQKYPFDHVSIPANILRTKRPNNTAIVRPTGVAFRWRPRIPGGIKGGLQKYNATNHYVKQPATTHTGVKGYQSQVYSVKGGQQTTLTRPILPIGAIPGETTNGKWRPPVVSIPGEGVCRVRNRVYQSGEFLESHNICMFNCQCVNGIVYCDKIECAGPPKGFRNCIGIRVVNDCCPRYQCVSPVTKETPSSSERTTEASTQKEKSTLPPVLSTSSVTAQTEASSNQFTSVKDKASATETGTEYYHTVAPAEKEDTSILKFTTVTMTPSEAETTLQPQSEVSTTTAETSVVQHHETTVSPEIKFTVKTISSSQTESPVSAETTFVAGIEETKGPLQTVSETTLKPQSQVSTTTERASVIQHDETTVSPVTNFAVETTSTFQTGSPVSAVTAFVASTKETKEPLPSVVKTTLQPQSEVSITTEKESIIQHRETTLSPVTTFAFETTSTFQTESPVPSETASVAGIEETKAPFAFISENTKLSLETETPSLLPVTDEHEIKTTISSTTVTPDKMPTSVLQTETLSLIEKENEIYDPSRTTFTERFSSSTTQRAPENTDIVIKEKDKRPAEPTTVTVTTSSFETDGSTSYQKTTTKYQDSTSEIPSESGEAELILSTHSEESTSLKTKFTEATKPTEEVPVTLSVVYTTLSSKANENASTEKPKTELLESTTGVSFSTFRPEITTLNSPKDEFSSLETKSTENIFDHSATATADITKVTLQEHHHSSEEPLHIHKLESERDTLFTSSKSETTTLLFTTEDSISVETTPVQHQETIVDSIKTSIATEKITPTIQKDYSISPEKTTLHPEIEPINLTEKKTDVDPENTEKFSSDTFKSDVATKMPKPENLSHENSSEVVHEKTTESLSNAFDRHTTLPLETQDSSLYEIKSSEKDLGLPGATEYLEKSSVTEKSDLPTHAEHSNVFKMSTTKATTSEGDPTTVIFETETTRHYLQTNNPFKKPTDDLLDTLEDSSKMSPAIISKPPSKTEVVHEIPTEELSKETTKTETSTFIINTAKLDFKEEDLSSDQRLSTDSGHTEESQPGKIILVASTSETEYPHSTETSVNVKENILDSITTISPSTLFSESEDSKTSNQKTAESLGTSKYSPEETFVEKTTAPVPEKEPDPFKISTANLIDIKPDSSFASPEDEFEELSNEKIFESSTESQTVGPIKTTGFSPITSSEFKLPTSIIKEALIIDEKVSKSTSEPTDKTPSSFEVEITTSFLQTTDSSLNKLDSVSMVVTDMPNVANTTFLFGIGESKLQETSTANSEVSSHDSFNTNLETENTVFIPLEETWILSRKSNLTNSKVSNEVPSLTVSTDAVPEGEDLISFQNDFVSEIITPTLEHTSTDDDRITVSQATDLRSTENTPTTISATDNNSSVQTRVHDATTLSFETEPSSLFVFSSKDISDPEKFSSITTATTEAATFSVEQEESRDKITTIKAFPTDSIYNSASTVSTQESRLPDQTTSFSASELSSESVMKESTKTSINVPEKFMTILHQTDESTSGESTISSMSETSKSDSDDMTTFLHKVTPSTSSSETIKPSVIEISTTDTSTSYPQTDYFSSVEKISTVVSDMKSSSSETSSNAEKKILSSTTADFISGETSIYTLVDKKDDSSVLSTESKIPELSFKPDISAINEIISTEIQNSTPDSSLVISDTTLFHETGHPNTLKDFDEASKETSILSDFTSTVQEEKVSHPKDLTLFQTTTKVSSDIESNSLLKTTIAVPSSVTEDSFTTSEINKELFDSSTYISKQNFEGVSTASSSQKDQSSFESSNADIEDTRNVILEQISTGLGLASSTQSEHSSVPSIRENTKYLSFITKNVDTTTLNPGEIDSSSFKTSTISVSDISEDSSTVSLATEKTTVSSSAENLNLFENNEPEILDISSSTTFTNEKSESFPHTDDLYFSQSSAPFMDTSKDAFEEKFEASSEKSIPHTDISLLNKKTNATYFETTKHYQSTSESESVTLTSEVKYSTTTKPLSTIGSEYATTIIKFPLSDTKTMHPDSEYASTVDTTKATTPEHSENISTETTASNTTLLDHTHTDISFETSTAYVSDIINSSLVTRYDTTVKSVSLPEVATSSPENLISNFEAFSTKKQQESTEKSNINYDSIIHDETLSQPLAVSPENIVSQSESFISSIFPETTSDFPTVRPGIFILKEIIPQKSTGIPESLVFNTELEDKIKTSESTKYPSIASIENDETKFSNQKNDFVFFENVTPNERETVKDSTSTLLSTEANKQSSKAYDSKDRTSVPVTTSVPSASTEAATIPQEEYTYEQENANTVDHNTAKDSELTTFREKFTSSQTENYAIFEKSKAPVAENITDSPQPISESVLKTTLKEEFSIYNNATNVGYEQNTSALLETDYDNRKSEFITETDNTMLFESTTASIILPAAISTFKATLPNEAVTLFFEEKIDAHGTSTGGETTDTSITSLESKSTTTETQKSTINDKVNAFDLKSVQDSSTHPPKDEFTTQYEKNKDLTSSEIFTEASKVITEKTDTLSPQTDYSIVSKDLVSITVQNTTHVSKTSTSGSAVTSLQTSSSVSEISATDFEGDKTDSITETSSEHTISSFSSAKISDLLEETTKVSQPELLSSVAHSLSETATSSSQEVDSLSPETLHVEEMGPVESFIIGSSLSTTFSADSETSSHQTDKPITLDPKIASSILEGSTQDGTHTPTIAAADLTKTSESDTSTSFYTSSPPTSETFDDSSVKKSVTQTILFSTQTDDIIHLDASEGSDSKTDDFSLITNNVETTTVSQKDVFVPSKTTYEASETVTDSSLDSIKETLLDLQTEESRRGINSSVDAVQQVMNTSLHHSTTLSPQTEDNLVETSNADSELLQETSIKDLVTDKTYVPPQTEASTSSDKSHIEISGFSAVSSVTTFENDTSTLHPPVKRISLSPTSVSVPETTESTLSTIASSGTTLSLTESFPSFKTTNENTPKTEKETSVGTFETKFIALSSQTEDSNLPTMSSSTTSDTTDDFSTTVQTTYSSHSEDIGIETSPTRSTKVTDKAFSITSMDVTTTLPPQTRDYSKLEISSVSVAELGKDSSVTTSVKDIEFSSEKDASSFDFSTVNTKLDPNNNLPLVFESNEIAPETEDVSLFMKTTTHVKTESKTPIIPEWASSLVSQSSFSSFEVSTIGPLDTTNDTSVSHDETIIPVEIFSGFMTSSPENLISQDRISSSSTMFPQDDQEFTVKDHHDSTSFYEFIPGHKTTDIDRVTDISSTYEENEIKTTKLDLIPEKSEDSTRHEIEIQTFASNETESHSFSVKPDNISVTYEIKDEIAKHTDKLVTDKPTDITYQYVTTFSSFPSTKPDSFYNGTNEDITSVSTVKYDDFSTQKEPDSQSGDYSDDPYRSQTVLPEITEITEKKHGNNDVFDVPPEVLTENENIKEILTIVKDYDDSSPQEPTSNASVLEIKLKPTTAAISFSALSENITSTTIFPTPESDDYIKSETTDGIEEQFHTSIAFDHDMESFSTGQLNKTSSTLGVVLHDLPSKKIELTTEETQTNELPMVSHSSENTSVIITEKEKQTHQSESEFTSSTQNIIYNVTAKIEHDLKKYNLSTTAVPFVFKEYQTTHVHSTLEDFTVSTDKVILHDEINRENVTDIKFETTETSSEFTFPHDIDNAKQVFNIKLNKTDLKVPGEHVDEITDAFTSAEDLLETNYHSFNNKSDIDPKRTSEDSITEAHSESPLPSSTNIIESTKVTIYPELNETDLEVSDLHVEEDLHSIHSITERTPEDSFESSSHGSIEFTGVTEDNLNKETSETRSQSTLQDDVGYVDHSAQKQNKTDFIASDLAEQQGVSVTTPKTFIKTKTGYTSKYHGESSPSPGWVVHTLDDEVIKELSTVFPASPSSFVYETHSSSTSDTSAYPVVTQSDSEVCYFEGKVYLTSEQIPRSQVCEFCFCFKGDIICLQQTCPPPIKGCFAIPIDGFCCPRYHCPVQQMWIESSSNTQTTSTTILPLSRFIPQRKVQTPVVSGCRVDGTTYGLHDVVWKASTACMLCRCDYGGIMQCDPQPCRPDGPTIQHIYAQTYHKK